MERLQNMYYGLHLYFSGLSLRKASERLSRQVSPREKSNQNMISVEQFDKAGQQISSIRGDSI